jgi:two-component system sensor histidine kinase GlrK
MQLAARLDQQDDAGLRRLGHALSQWGKQSQALLAGGEHPVSAWSTQYDSLSGLGAGLESRIRQLGEVQRKQWDSNLREKRQQADRVAILSLCLAVFSGLLLAWLLVRPLQQLRGKIAALSQGVRGQSWLMSAPADIVQLASALGELDHRLARLEEDKADFFRHVSHELKTPLAAIQEASSLLQDQIPGPLLPSQQEIVSITLSNTRLLRQRVDALLRHDAANWLAQPLDMRVHELHALIEVAAASMRPLLQQKRITLELSQDSLLVPVDNEQLRQEPAEDLSGLSMLLGSLLNERKRHEEAMQRSNAQLAEQQHRADELAAKLEALRLIEQSMVNKASKKIQP